MRHMAIMNAESLHMVERLLGHRRAATTDRCAHPDDAMLSVPTDQVEKAINEPGP